MLGVFPSKLELGENKKESNPSWTYYNNNSNNNNNNNWIY